MKALFITAIATLLLTSSCKDSCPSCSVIILNAEQYSYKVTFQGWDDKPADFVIPTQGTKTIVIPNGKKITVVGDLLSPFAHNDFSEVIECDGGCADIALILQQ